MKTSKSWPIPTMPSWMVRWKMSKASVPWLPPKRLPSKTISLPPGRYVGIVEQQDDGEPFEEKMDRLTKELSGLFQKSHELEAQIKERLGAIGYEV